MQAAAPAWVQDTGASLIELIKTGGGIPREQGCREFVGLMKGITGMNITH